MPETRAIRDYLLDRLSELAVQHVFGVPGDYNLGLLERIAARPRMTWVGTANELNAAYAADAPANWHREIARKAPPAPLLDAKVSAYTARYGRSAAVGMMAAAGEDAGAFDIATVPACRRRGFGTAVVTRAVLDADDPGAVFVFCAAAEDGIPRYASSPVARPQRHGLISPPRDVAEHSMGMMMRPYDYVAAGGGIAGCAAAARRSADPSARVLLLEAGPADGPGQMADSRAFLTLLGSDVDWKYETVPQQGTGGEVRAWARGRVLGGSGSINAMGRIRGHRCNYDGWHAAGAIGWGYAGLLSYFKRSETAPGRDPAYRGTNGPILVAPAPSVTRRRRRFSTPSVRRATPPARTSTAGTRKARAGGKATS
jgi:ribosomal protein S18 acetylase RimI-like enzyme